MAIIVLALDALDSALVDYFDLDGFRLESNTRMDTFAHMQDAPYTPEVWATVATGLHPEDHGVTDEGISHWNNPVIEFASRVTGRLPLGLRISLGKVARKTTGADYAVGSTDQPTIFDGDDRVVHNWPGVVRGEEVVKVWDIIGKEGQTQGEFEREIYANAASKFAWAEEMIRHDLALIGVHIHALDALGHAYAEQEADLYEAYHWASEWVERIQNEMGEDDELLILSDHGMVVDFYSDEDDRDMEIAFHNWRAYAASTCDSVPESVFDVKDWLEPKLEHHEDRSEELELPKDQLRQLGYIE